MVRLSMSTFAGTARTVVAVGTWRDSSMFDAIALAGPRRAVTRSWDSSCSSRSLCGSWAGIGFCPERFSRIPACFGASVSFLPAPVRASGCSAGADAFAGPAGVCRGCALRPAEAASADRVRAPCSAESAEREVFEAGEGAGFLEPRSPDSAACICSKMGHHFSSTAFRSCWYFSNSSSTSHSLPANSSGIWCCG